MSVNHVILYGRVSRDGVLRYSNQGLQVLSWGFCVNDRKKNVDTGVWEDVPNFLDCVMFGKYAEHMAPYLIKGNPLIIEGRLRWNKWKDDTGTDRSKVEILVENITFTSGSFSTKPSVAQETEIV